MAKEFLPDVSMVRLRKLHKKEKEPKAKARLLACMHRKSGKTIIEIAKAVNEPRSTVTDWLKRISVGGLDSIHDVKNKGAQSRLDERQIRMLMMDLDAGPAAAGLGSGTWTISLIRMHIKRTFNVEYHVHSVWDIMKRLGYAHLKPSPRDRRAASPSETKTFQKSSERHDPGWTRMHDRVP